MGSGGVPIFVYPLRVEKEQGEGTLEGLFDSIDSNLKGAVEVYERKLVPVIDALQVAIEKATLKLVEVAPVLARLYEWFEVAPQRFRDVLASRGLPPVNLPLEDLTATIRVLEEQGEEAAATYYEQAMAAMVELPEWRREIHERFGAYSKRPERAPILVEALEVYFAGMYAVAVPTLVAQFEGVLVDLTGFDKRNTAGVKTGRNLIKRLFADLIKDDPLFAPHAEEFLANTWLADFHHGDGRDHGLARHSIMHGANVTYANERMARRALLWLDFLLELAEMTGGRSQQAG